MLDFWEGDFPKISKANSFTCDGNIFYIKKIGDLYVAYDYKTKVNVAFTHHGKEKLLQFLENNIELVKQRITNGR